MAETFDEQRFRDLIERFRMLNPEQIELIEQELLTFAEQHAAKAFPILKEEADIVLQLYLDSPVKRAERGGIEKFYYFLNKVSKKMIDAGEIPETQPENPASVALVPRHYYNTVQWLTVKSKADVPDGIATAIDASRRRNELIDSVLEPLFRVMLKFDFKGAIKWQLAQAGDHDAPCDPDVARDLIRAWTTEIERLPDEAVRKVIEWADDEMVFRHWPAVTAQADAFLRRLCLLHWYKSDASRKPSLAKLRARHPFMDNEKLLRWLKAGVTKLGESIDFFCEQSETIASDELAEDDRTWRQDAMFRELVWLSEVIRPLLLLSDLLLAKPSGSLTFSMAVFGFTTEFKQRWNARLIEQCRKAVRRCFIRDMVNKRKPHHTIHKLSFGDDVFEQNLLSELDIVSETFKTLEQREIVVERLAHSYASYRAEPLMAQEFGLRYRRMMRVLHEDQLRRVLREEQFKEVQEFADILIDLSTIASLSRRFISDRRALDRSTEEIVAADADYQKEIRSLRARHIRQMLKV